MPFFSDLLTGKLNNVQKNPAEIGTMLGLMGQAVAPKDSWQQNLGGTMAQVGQAQMMQDFLKQYMRPTPEGTGGVTKENVVTGPMGEKKVTLDIEAPVPGMTAAAVPGAAPTTPAQTGVAPVSPVTPAVEPTSPFVPGPATGLPTSRMMGLMPDQMQALMGFTQQDKALKLREMEAAREAELRKMQMDALAKHREIQAKAAAAKETRLGEQFEETTAQREEDLDFRKEAFKFDKEYKTAKLKADKQADLLKFLSDQKQSLGDVKHLEKTSKDIYNLQTLIDRDGNTVTPPSRQAMASMMDIYMKAIGDQADIDKITIEKTAVPGWWNDIKEPFDIYIPVEKGQRASDEEIKRQLIGSGRLDERQADYVIGLLGD